MKIGRRSVVVVTGGGHGIGRALCLRFAKEGAKVVVADLDLAAAEQTATECKGMAVRCDVSKEYEVKALVARATEAHKHIDVFCSNAGIFLEGGVDATDAYWERIFAVNYWAHLYAARAVLPQMVERGEGYLVQVVSAAGLLTQIGSALYSVTKHAALALAEWMAIEYGDRGIKVSAVCPQGVRTRMLLGEHGDEEHFLKEGAIEPEDVAEAVIEGMAEERFLILPHPEVKTYFERKASDYDRWLAGMRRLRGKVAGTEASKRLSKRS